MNGTLRFDCFKESICEHYLPRARRRTYERSSRSSVCLIARGRFRHVDDPLMAAPLDRTAGQRQTSVFTARKCQPTSRIYRINWKEIHTWINVVRIIIGASAGSKFYFLFTITLSNPDIAKVNLASKACHHHFRL
jgi:hypothetical protein